MQGRVEILHRNFLQRVKDGGLPDVALPDLSEADVTPDLLLRLFDSQLLSRHLDYEARTLQAAGEGFYTIGSAGHEGNAAVAAAFCIDDMAFLHYRDAAFFLQRATLQPKCDPVRDMLLSFMASSDDPISGGRHKVLGSKALSIPPQTSTIASHLPKAVGAAASIALNKRLGREGTLPSDGIILCSFGDASANHSTAQGAINTANWMAYQNMRLPLVLVCEDNGIGISTPTPEGWIHAAFHNKPGIAYYSCNGLNMLETYLAAREVERYVRTRHKPAFLHLRCVRLLGHAGADVEQSYRSERAIEEAEAHDPLLYSAALLIGYNILTPEGVLERYHKAADRVAKTAKKLLGAPRLDSAEEVMASILPPARKLPRAKAPTKKARDALFGNELAAMQSPAHLARIINWTLADLMLEQENIVLAGEDIGAKGGVYGVTTKLQAKFGAHRVIDTLLDEQSILGLGIGLAHNDMLPVLEIQFLAYLHNAEDQLRGEAATLSFFSQGQYTNPILLRLPGLAYQKGFGGHFHNDNSIAVLRDIPGIIVACPSHGANAVPLLRECVRLVREEQRVVVFLEPIALYMTRDLHAPGDGLYCAVYDEARNVPPIAFGEPGIYGDGEELCILTYGNGCYLSRRAAKMLAEEHRQKVRIIDLRWLHPLDMERIAEAVGGCKKLLIVDECRRTGSLSETLLTGLYECLPHRPEIRRVCAEDSFIPLGKAATLTLPSVEQIVATILEFV